MNVFLIAAITADGFIGRDDGHTADWTGREDKKVFVELTKRAGTMIMGARTFASIGRALPGRHTIVYTHHQERISVLEVETTDEAPAMLIERLAKSGADEVAICGGAVIYDMFMQANVVDELFLTVVPIVFGTGVPLFKSPLDARLELLEQTQLADGAILLHYAVQHQDTP